jgi:hypothetical protein
MIELNDYSAPGSIDCIHSHVERVGEYFGMGAETKPSIEASIISSLVSFSEC